MGGNCLIPEEEEAMGPGVATKYPSMSASTEGSCKLPTTPFFMPQLLLGNRYPSASPSLHAGLDIWVA